MPAKSVVYTRNAARALRKYRSMSARITAKIENYASDPASLGNVVTELVGKDYRRLRVGGFRDLFRETPTEVIVLDIGPRGGIYD